MTAPQPPHPYERPPEHGSSSDARVAATLVAVLETVQAIGVTLDLDGCVTFANRYLLTLTGWPAEAVLGASWFERFLPDDDPAGGGRAKLERRFRESIASGTIWPHHENAIVTRDGARRIVAWDNTLLRDERGTVVGTVSIGRDVTEERAILAQERAARHEVEAERLRAEEANRVKAEFLATMSHELRTPLNAIGGYVQLLELGVHGSLTPSQRDALERVQGAQRHLLRLINDVLNFAKLEAGKLAYDLRAVRVGDLVDAVVPLVAPQVGARGQQLDVALDDPDAHVWADRDKLAQVLLNLLSNAIRFTAPGGRITIVTTCEAMPEGRLALCVRDTGRGIPPAKLESIFEPFVQVETGRTRTHEGTGLGLAISRDLARGMGGDLVASSAEGEGSTFTIMLRRTERPDGAMIDRRVRDDRRQGHDRRQRRAVAER